jgi:hypothetical protein
MAAVLKLLRPRKRETMQDTFRKGGRALELKAAKEILAEVFGIRIFEVDEMIANRFSDCHECRKEMELWPQEFQLEE